MNLTKTLLLTATTLAALTASIPHASAAIAHLPLGAGDVVQAVEPPGVNVATQSILGHNALVLRTEAPTLVGVRVQHHDGTTTDHLVLTSGYRPDDVLDDTHALRQDAAALAAALANTTGRVDHLALAMQDQAPVIASANATAAANLDMARAQAARLNLTLAAANAAQHAAQNIHVPEPDLSAVTDEAQAARAAATQARDHADRLLTFTILNAALSGIAVAVVLHGNDLLPRLPHLHLKERLAQLKGDEDPEPAETPWPAVDEEQIAANRALAAELLPGHNGSGPAPHEGAEIQAETPGRGTTDADSSTGSAPPATHQSEPTAPAAPDPEDVPEPPAASEPAPKAQDPAPAQDPATATDPPAPEDPPEESQRGRDDAGSLHVPGGLAQTHPLN